MAIKDLTKELSEQSNHDCIWLDGALVDFGNGATTENYFCTCGDVSIRVEKGKLREING